MSSTTDSSVTLPPLPELQVIRETWCSQAATDAVLSYLWRHAPHLVQRQLKLEHLNYDQTYLMELSHIIDFFTKVAAKEVDVPTTHLGMLDLLFELSRRLRVAASLPEWHIRGKPLSDGPQDQMPKMPVMPIHSAAESSPFFITQNQTDRIIEDAYKLRPDLFYDLAEALRRGGIGHHGIFNELKLVFQKASLSGDNLTPSKAARIGAEAARRLRVLCEIDTNPNEGK